MVLSQIGIPGSQELIILFLLLFLALPVLVLYFVFRWLSGVGSDETSQSADDAAAEE